MLLKDAKDIRVGTAQAKAVYLGSTKLWPLIPSTAPQVTNAITGGTSSTVDGTVYPSASFTPVAGDWLVVGVDAAATAAAAPTLVASGNGITFTRLPLVATKNTSLDRVYVFVANQLVGASPVAMTVTFNCPTDAATATVISVARVTNMNKVGTAGVRQSAKVDNVLSGTAPSVVLPGPCLTTNPTLFFNYVQVGTGTLPPSNWTEQVDANTSSPAGSGGYSSRNAGFTGSTITMASANNGAGCAIALELDASPAWKPSDLTGLTVWHDAADYTPGSWPNKAGGAAPAFVGSPAPVLAPAALNGLPVVRFKFDEGRLRGTGMCVDGSYDLTVLHVSRMRGPNIGRIFTNTYPPHNFLVGTHTSGEPVCYDNGWILDTPPWVTANFPYPFAMYGAVCTNTPVVNTQFWKNGSMIAQAGTSAGHGNLYNFSGYDATGNQETCDCDIAEVIVYDRKLSDADRQLVEGYLRTKWGL